MIIGSKLLPIIMTKIWGGGKSIYFAYQQKLGGGHVPPVPYTPPAHGFQQRNIGDRKVHLLLLVLNERGQWVACPPDE